MVSILVAVAFLMAAEPPEAPDMKSGRMQVLDLWRRLEGATKEAADLRAASQACESRVKALESDNRATREVALKYMDEGRQLRESRDDWLLRAQLIASVIAEPPKCASECKALGLCSFIFPTMECVAARDRDCAKSFICSQGKKCRAVNGSCVE